MGATTNPFKIQYRWLVPETDPVKSNEQVFVPAGAWVDLPYGGDYQEPYTFDAQNGYYRVDEEWITGPLDTGLRGDQFVGLEMCITDTDCNSAGGVYDRDAVVVFSATNPPFDSITNVLDPTVVAAALLTPHQSFLPVIDDGSLRATVSGSTATLSWTLADPDLNATVSVSFGDDPTGGETASTGLMSNTVQVGGLEGGQTYYWRIAAADPDMHVDESLIQSFTVPSGPIDEVMLDEPPDGGQNVATTTSLDWHVNNAEHGLTFSAFLNICNPPGTQCFDDPTTQVCGGLTVESCDPTSGDTPCTPVELQPNSWYRYKVVAHAPDGLDYSASASFMTGNAALPAESVALVLPFDNDGSAPWYHPCYKWNTDGGCEPDFTWLCTRKDRVVAVWACEPYTLNSCDTNCGSNKCKKGADIDPDTAYLWAIATTTQDNCNPGFANCQDEVWTPTRRFTTAGPTLTTPTLTQPAQQRKHRGPRGRHGHLQLDSGDPYASHHTRDLSTRGRER